MVNAQINVETNFEDAVKTVSNLEGEIPDSASDAARRIARDWRKTGQMIMLRRGNTVTGQGLRSMETTKTGKASYGVTGNQYLATLDTGRAAGTIPDTNNPRFIAAARSYGMSRQQLALSIARKGTRPYPWMDESTKRVQRNAPKRVKISMNKAIRESTSVL